MEENNNVTNRSSGENLLKPRNNRFPVIWTLKNLMCKETKGENIENQIKAKKSPEIDGISRGQAYLY